MTLLTLAEVCQCTPSEDLAQSVNQFFETNMYILVQSLGLVIYFISQAERADVPLDDYHYPQDQRHCHAFSVVTSDRLLCKPMFTLTLHCHSKVCTGIILCSVEAK